MPHLYCRAQHPCAVLFWARCARFRSFLRLRTLVASRSPWCDASNSRIHFSRSDLLRAPHFKASTLAVGVNCVRLLRPAFNATPRLRSGQSPPGRSAHDTSQGTSTCQLTVLGLVQDQPKLAIVMKVMGRTGSRGQVRASMPRRCRPLGSLLACTACLRSQLLTMPPLLARCAGSHVSTAQSAQMRVVQGTNGRPAPRLLGSTTSLHTCQKTCTRPINTLWCRCAWLPWCRRVCTRA